MAGVGFRATFGPTALSAGVAAVVARVNAAANHRVRLEEIELSFNGTNPLATPVRVDFVRLSDDGTMQAVTPAKTDPTHDEALQVTAAGKGAAEPTVSAILRSFYVHPQTGRVWQAPFARQEVIPGGTRWGIQCTAPAAVDVLVNVEGEE